MTRRMGRRGAVGTAAGFLMLVMLVSGCGLLLNPFHGRDAKTVLFPADYQSTYVLVRPCRQTVRYGGGGGVKVYINPESLDAYNALWNAPDSKARLPVGTVLVKEIHIGSIHCKNPVSLWSAIKKEAAGYNPSDGDWRWQSVAADRTIREKEDGDYPRCPVCHIGTSECSGFGKLAGYDYTCTRRVATDP